MPRLTAAPARPLARHRILFLLLILSWAISWPVVKIGVAAVPPIWYACFRYWIATVCLFVIAIARRESGVPPRSGWPLGGIGRAADGCVFCSDRNGVDCSSTRASVCHRIFYTRLGCSARGVVVARTCVASREGRRRAWRVRCARDCAARRAHRRSETDCGECDARARLRTLASLAPHRLPTSVQSRPRSLTGPWWKPDVIFRQGRCQWRSWQRRALAL
jgi:hypothetical protein